MKLVSAILAKDEASPSRYLRRVLTRCLSFSDTVVLLDDNSTDSTPDIAREMGCVVETRTGEAAWGKEASARRELWELACKYATGPNDWILICDADQILVGDVRGLCLSKEANAFAFILYDCWSETEYREDELWQAHKNPRVWLAAPNRVPQGWVPEWNAREVHTGHLPTNFPLVAIAAPPDAYYWLHLGYARPEHRQAKYAQYAKTFDLMSEAERRHAESILH